MSRANSIRLLAIGSVFLSGVLRDGIGCLLVAEERPNVLFLAVDDLNDWVGAYQGHPQGMTPNIDRLSAEGVTFLKAYCAAPACNPSRAALLTGRRPSTSGVYHNSNPWRKAMPDAITIPQHFAKAGYHVVGSGKIFHGGQEDPQSWQDYRYHGADPKPGNAILQDPHSRAGTIIFGRLDVDDTAMNDYHMASYAVEYLQAEHDKPFFLACGIFRPHMPWQVPSKYYDMFPVDSIVLPVTRDDDLDDVPAAGVKMAKPNGDHARVLATDNWKYAIQAYLASIAFADGQVGRILDELERSQYKDNTIVVLWSDHGWHLGEKQHWRKFALWEEATRVVYMVRAPGVTKPGGRCQRTVDLMSIYPTLCELCGLTTPAGVEGKSLSNLLHDPEHAWEWPAITTHGLGNHAIRNEQFRLIHYADGSRELYDHDADPDEFKNLASDKAYEQTIHELERWLPSSEAAEQLH